MIVIDALTTYPADLTTAKGLPGRHWCHLWSTLPGADGSRELAAFAQRIGLKPAWLQQRGQDNREHYDCTRWMRLAAIKAGAVEVDAYAYARARLAGPEALALYLAACVPAKRHPVFGVTPPPNEPHGCTGGGGRTLRR